MTNSNHTFRRLLLIAALFLACGAAAYGQQLQRFTDCTIGKKVSTNNGRTGVITKLDVTWSYCFVRFDDNGKEESYLYSLLNSVGGLDPKDQKLAVGVYECISLGKGSTGNLRITGPDSYSFGGASGKYRVEASGKIVFSTGPFSKYNSKLLSNGRVGISDNAENFYPISCELNKNLH